MLGEFFVRHFVEPIMYYEGYNLVNTVVYAVIMLALSFFVIFPALDRRGIKFSLRFMLALFPYIVFGIGLRIMEDMHLLPRSPFPWEIGYYFISPGIWLLIGVAAIAALLVSLYMEKRLGIEFHLCFAVIGLALCLPVLVFDLMYFVVWDGFLIIIAMAAAITAIAFVAVEHFRKGFFAERLNLLVLGGQALDGCATFVASQFYSCGEQHLLSEAVISFSPFGFVLLKVALALIIIYYVDREVENRNLAAFIKLFIIIIGFATGLRDLFTVAVGTCL